MPAAATSALLHVKNPPRVFRGYEEQLVSAAPGWRDGS